MEQEKLNKILNLHKKWLNSEPDGERANLCGADLYDANLYGAVLDFSCFPLWCGSLGVHFDDKQIIDPFPKI